MKVVVQRVKDQVAWSMGELYPKSVKVICWSALPTAIRWKKSGKWQKNCQFTHFRR